MCYKDSTGAGSPQGKEGGRRGQRRKECMKGREETTSTKLSLEGTETGQKSPEGR